MTSITNEVDASSSLSSGGIGDGESVCYLCLDGDLDDDGRPLRRDCACRGTDAGFVHLSYRVLLNMQKQKVRDGMVVIWMNSCSHGKHVLAVINTTRMSLLLISHPSLSRSFEGSIQTIHKCRWRLLV